MGVIRNILPAGLALATTGAAQLTSPGGVGRLPALGWNSWNEYGCNIDESVFLKVGHHLVDYGLKDLGYEYVNIDDCWSDKVLRRDNTTKEIIPDYVKFPNGIKHVADEIHKLGLKVGIYSNAGLSTCGGFAASLGYEDIDAATFAKWGIDYLKYDNCAVPEEWWDDWKYVPENWFGGPPNEKQDDGSPVNSKTDKPAPPGYDWATSNSAERFRRMRDELLKQDRTIQYSLCAWGHAHVEQWGNDTGHSWRMWGDIYPVWHGKHEWSWGIAPILNHASFFWNTTDFWGHNDWDMLEVGNGELTLAESRSHFTLWAALKSPLIIGTRLEGIKPEVLAILANKELVDFNQDPIVGASAKPYDWGLGREFGSWNQTNPAEYWAGESSKGTHVFILNTLDVEDEKVVVFADVPGLEAGKRYVVHNMWTGSDLGAFEDSFKIDLDAHDTAALRINEIVCPKKRALTDQETD
ncbi:hypothetical protein ACHAQF_001714 [Verticillium nonalfalfae]